MNVLIDYHTDYFKTIILIDSEITNTFIASVTSLNIAMLDHLDSLFNNMQ